MESNLPNFTTSPALTTQSPTSSSLYIYTSIFSGIFIALLAFITTTGNGLLLLAIWKDPLKTLRTPTTYFVVGLSAADFLTGLFVSPVFAFFRIVTFSNAELTRSAAAANAAKFSTSASLLTMNASYLILLFLTWSQFAAICFPHRHRSLVSKRRVATCVVLIYLYAFVFALLQPLGVENELLLHLDLFMNTIPSLILLILAYMCLYVAYRRQIARISSLRTQPGHAARKGRTSRRGERQFTIVNLLLVLFVVLCTLPSTILWCFKLYWTNMPSAPKTRLDVAALHAANVLLLKFALDPFLYCWRLPHYRRSLRCVLVCDEGRALRWQTFSQTSNMPVVGVARSLSRYPATGTNREGTSSKAVQNCHVLEVQSVV